jgi:hypothetical protein
MMKLQHVILKAMAKRLSWIAAAEIAGMSVRNMQRKRQGYVEHGYDGLFDQRRRRTIYPGQHRACLRFLQYEQVQ